MRWGLLLCLWLQGCSTFLVDTAVPCSIDQVKAITFPWRSNINCTRENAREGQVTHAASDKFDQWVVLDRFSRREKDESTGTEKFRLFLVIQPVSSKSVDDIVTVEVTDLPPQMLPDVGKLKDKFPEFEFDIEARTE